MEQSSTWGSESRSDGEEIPRLRPGVTFCNVALFYIEGSLAIRPMPKQDDHPFSAVLVFLLRYRYCHNRRQSPPTATWARDINPLHIQFYSRQLLLLCVSVEAGTDSSVSRVQAIGRNAGTFLRVQTCSRTHPNTYHLVPWFLSRGGGKAGGARNWQLTTADSN